MDTPTWIGIISGIVSVALAIFSIFISFTFYKWSDISNKEISNISKSISERTDYLEKLFDKMFDSTFSLVKDESEAMRKHLFEKTDIGKVATTNGSKAIEIVSFIKDNSGKTSKEICSSLQIKDEEFDLALQELTRNSLVYSNEGKYYINSSHISDNLGNS